jgi:hypothetical protein
MTVTDPILLEEGITQQRIQWALGIQNHSIALQGKIVHGGNFMPAKKKAAKKKKKH